MVRDTLTIGAPELAQALTVSVGVTASLVTVVPAVIVSVTPPQLGDAELVVALPLVCRAVLDRRSSNIFYPSQASPLTFPLQVPLA